ncbi:Kinetochore-associated protein MTW1 [Teratosphaeria destructans]|uniref:Kinetochore-associated protein MTW1 n=1 Tax=Teratosphaeria destructans TaxID=418781 RepID=A0A9W7SS98_9PEZI|nr:Kinetochore-associated protein MTW1 [Teratosphaeria destructans]
MAARRTAATASPAKRKRADHGSGNNDMSKMTTLQKEKAVLTELMGYTPLSLMDDIIDSTNTVNLHGLDGVEKALLAVPARALGFRLSDTDTAADADSETREAALEQKKKDEIDSGMVKLETLLNSATDKDMDKFEIYCLRNIFTMGLQNGQDLVDRIVLEHYKGLDFEAATNAEALMEQIKHGQAVNHEQDKLGVLLASKDAEQISILQQLKAYEEKFAFLEAGTATENDVKYLTDQIPFLQQQVKALEAIRVKDAAAGAQDIARADYIADRAGRAHERVFEQK